MNVIYKKPLIVQNEDIRKEINLKLEEIAHYLSTLTPKRNLPIGLFTGSAGIALFLFYYSRYKNDEYVADKAMEFLSYSVNEIDKDFHHTFCGGISGVCWVVRHLIAEEFIDSDSAEILDFFDNSLCEQVTYHSSIGNFDFLHGAIGSALYLLKRTNVSFVTQTTEHTIDWLHHSKFENNSLCYWESKFAKNNDNAINICLSHGMSSILLYLCRAFEANINKPVCQELSKKSIAFLLDHENSSNNRISMFPTFNKLSGPSFSRLGWCYGDLGIAMAIWCYGNTFNDDLMKKKSIEIFKFSSGRKDLRENCVIDASVCHGTAGIAQIYKRMFYYTGLEDFKDTALYWLEQTLSMSKYEDGIAGYKSEGKNKNIDLLNGIAGIGLVLLSFLTNEETNWDECLLLS